MKYLINNEEDCHANKINSLLSEVIIFDCMVAFAKMSGFNMIKNTLEKALTRNANNQKARFRFIFGLDFYQTEPKLLKELLKLSEKHKNLSLFLSTDECVFHPKVYAFKTPRANYVVTGSANLTSGGLRTNNENSLLVNSSEIRKSVLKQINQLIKNNKIIKATKDNINEYEEKYNIYKVRKDYFERKANEAIQNPVEGDFETLEAILDLMKQRGNFEEDVAHRIESRDSAINQLNLIARERNINAQSFIRLYEPLIQGENHYWHSGLLYFNKNEIAINAGLFQAALRAVKRLNNPTLQEAYSTLHTRFNNISGAGVNVITEILHTIDNTRFAVMNKNSVSGMSRANYLFRNTAMNYVDCDIYQRFCDNAQNIREALNLNNFTELDALFNYAYWNVEE
jgi:HKD family nuclease